LRNPTKRTWETNCCNKQKSREKKNGEDMRCRTGGSTEREREREREREGEREMRT